MNEVMLLTGEPIDIVAESAKLSPSPLNGERAGVRGAITDRLS